jgi:hypothetical protein
LEVIYSKGTIPMSHAPIYDPNTVWTSIFEQMAEGQSLSAILRQKGYPSYSWCKQKLRDDNELRRQYDTAIEDRADRLADELIELAWTPLPQGLDGRGMSAWVQHLRVKIDVLKWTASKLRPRVYGDRIEMAVTDNRISITEALKMAETRLSELPRVQSKDVIDVVSREV